MDKFERINELLPFYENLLTQRQKEIVRYYYYDNLSISEIAETLKISRNGVFDCLKKCEVLLEEYESKLKLCANYGQRMKLYDKLCEVNNAQVNQIAEELRELEESL